MRVSYQLFCIAIVFVGLNGNAQTIDGCPKNEHACLDVINSSFCLQSNAGSGGTAEAFAECVSYEGAASSLPGATKVSSYQSCQLYNTFQ